MEKRLRSKLGKLEKKSSSIHFFSLGHLPKKVDFAPLERQTIEFEPGKIAYLLGVDLAFDAAAIEKWLLEDKNRMVHLVEIDPFEIWRFLHDVSSAKILSLPRLFIDLGREPPKIYPTEKIICLASQKVQKEQKQWFLDFEKMLYGRAIKALSQLHLRLSTLVHAGEFLYKTSYFEKGSFPFHLKNSCSLLAATLCGAGPWLTDPHPESVIIASGMGVICLLKRGIIPDIAVFTDPSEVQADLLALFDKLSIPLVYTPSVHPKIFDRFTSVQFCLPIPSGAFERHFWGPAAIRAEKLLGDLSFGGSATMVALWLADYLGFKTIALNGIDCALKEGVRYAEKVKQAPSQGLFFTKPIVEKGVDGLVTTYPHWLLEREAIERFIAKRPRKQWICQSRGLVIRGTLHKDFVVTMDKKELMMGLGKEKIVLHKKRACWIERVKSLAKDIYLDGEAYFLLIAPIVESAKRWHPKELAPLMKKNHVKKQIKNLCKLLSLFLLVSCGSFEKSEKKKLMQKEKRVCAVVLQGGEKQLDLGPSQSFEVAGYPWERYGFLLLPISKEHFRCKGSSLSPPKTFLSYSGQLQTVQDCGGDHSLPLKNDQEYIDPMLIDLLNALQDKLGAKVIVLIGHVCPVHAIYDNPMAPHKDFKYQLGAKVAFYVEGNESQTVLKALADIYLQKDPNAVIKENSEEGWSSSMVMARSMKQEQEIYQAVTIEMKLDSQTKQSIYYDAKKAKALQKR